MTMMMMIITNEFLDALLSPNSVIRTTAESQLVSSSRNHNNILVLLEQQCRAYLQYLHTHINTTTTNNSSSSSNSNISTEKTRKDDCYIQLVAILLRRDIIQLGTIPIVLFEENNNDGNTSSRNVEALSVLLNQIMNELLSLLITIIQSSGSHTLTTHNSSQNSNNSVMMMIIKAISHVIAECVATWESITTVFLLANSHSSSSSTSLTTTSATTTTNMMMQRLRQHSHTMWEMTLSSSSSSSGTITMIITTLLHLWMAVVERAPTSFLSTITTTITTLDSGYHIEKKNMNENDDDDSILSFLYSCIQTFMMMMTPQQQQQQPDPNCHAVLLLWYEFIVSIAMAYQQQPQPKQNPSSSLSTFNDTSNKDMLANWGKLYLQPLLLPLLLTTATTSNLHHNDKSTTTTTWQNLLSTASIETPDLFSHLSYDLLQYSMEYLNSITATTDSNNNSHTCTTEAQLATVSVMASIVLYIHPHTSTDISTPRSSPPNMNVIFQVALSTCWSNGLLSSSKSPNDAVQQHPIFHHPMEPVTLEDGDYDNPYSYLDDDDNDDDEEYPDRFRYALEIMSDLFRAAPTVALSIIFPVLNNTTTTTTTTTDWMIHRAALAVWQCIMECIPMALGLDGIRHVTSIALSYWTASTSPPPPVRIQYQALQLLRTICECAVTTTKVTILGTNGTSSNNSNIDACFPYILQVSIQALSSPHTPIVVLACQTITSYCRPEFMDRGGSNVSQQQQRRVREQRTIQPYLNELFQALFASNTIGPLLLNGASTIHDNANIHCEGYDEASVVVQIKKMETIAYAIVPSLQSGGYSVLEPYYAHMMNTFMSFAVLLFDTTTSSNHLSTLVQRRAATSIEVMTMIGQTLCETTEDDDNDDNNSAMVVKQQFMNVAQQILHWILPALLSKDQKDNSTTTTMTILHRQLVSAAIRIATMYSSSEMDTIYPTYLASMIPHIVGQITDPAMDIELSEGDMNDLASSSTSRTQRSYTENLQNDGVESMTVTLPGRGITKVSINTTKIQDKVFMIRALYTQIVALQESFGPYCSASLDVILPLVTFRYSTEIRATSAQTVFAIFDASCRYSSDVTNDWIFPKGILPTTLRIISDQLVKEEHQIDIECIYALAESLQGCCGTMFEFTRNDKDGTINLIGNMTYSDTEILIRNVVQTLTACLQRRAVICQALNDGSCTGEDDRNEQMILLQKEENLLTPLVDAIGYTLKCYGPNFTSIFEQHVVPALMPYCGSDSDVNNIDVRARLSVVCLLDDCVEYCGIEAASKISPILLPLILFGINENHHNDPELTRASIYGIAQIARHASVAQNILLNHAQFLIQQLYQRITITTKDQLSSDDDDTNLAVFENSISALASLILFDQAPFHNDFYAGTYNISLGNIVHLFLGNLPLTVDYDEAMICHNGLCQMIESGTISITAQNYDVVVLCIRNTLESTAEDIDDDDDLMSLAQRLRNLQEVLQSPSFIANMKTTVASPCSVVGSVRSN